MVLNASRFLGFLQAAAVFAAAAMPAHAQQNVSVIRDAEIEALVADYARPIFKAAGLGRANTEIILVNDPSFNAFVAGRRMFINTGALMTAETPNEIIGVMAHEAGHIAGGHQERLRQQLESARTLSIVAGLIGAGAAIAGAASKNTAAAQAGAGIAVGGAEAARRGLLAYQRTEEATADRSAVTYLEKTGQSAAGMLKTFKRFEGMLSLSGVQVDPYQVSHPMPRERIAALQTLAEQSVNFGKADSPSLQARHDLMRAKIAAYTQGQGESARLLKRSGNAQAIAYGDAVRSLLYGNPAAALKKADMLAKGDPKSPWFQELRGDILLKANKPAQAAEAYAKAIRLDPRKSSMLQVGYAQALIATGKPEALDKAARTLNETLQRDRENAAGYALLAQAEGRRGNIAEAELATAEGYYYSGDIKQAKSFAARAQQKMKNGAPGWLRAQDILNTKTSKKKS